MNFVLKTMKSLLKMMKPVLKMMNFEERYPESAGQFAEVDWAARVVSPLRAMCNHPLFSAQSEAWLSVEFQPQLAGAKLKLPLRNSVPAKLSREGNTLATWQQLFESESVSVPQIFANLRSLVLLGYPAADLEKLIHSKL